MSVLTDIADAVTASLNAAGSSGSSSSGGGPFSLAFEAKRLHQPKHDLPELKTLRVSVLPKGQTITNATRTESSFDMAIDVGIQRHAADDAQVDELLGLADEIADHLRLKRLDGYPGAAFVSIDHDPVVAPEHLEKNRLVTSILTVTYRVLR